MATTSTKRLSDKRAQEREAAKQRDTRRRQLVLVLVGAVVLVLAGLLAYFTAQESGSAIRVADVAGSPEVLGELPLAPRDGAEDTVLDTPAPRVDGADFDGSSVAIGYPGSPQLLMFAAAWCPACQEEIREVVSWLDAGGLPDGVELTTVITGLDDGAPNWPPDAWLEAENYTGRVLVDDEDGSVAKAYGLPATPYWVALDADGRIVARITGMLPADQLDDLAATVAATG